MDQPWDHLLPAPTGENEAKFHRVAWAMAGTLLRSGPEALKVSRVARKAGVSRAWIYKYLGADAEQRLAFAVRLYGQAFAAPVVETPAADAATWLAAIQAGSAKGLHDVLAAPWCVLVYLRYRHAHNTIGAQIRDLEREELARFVAWMPASLRRDPKRARQFALTFHAARLGLFHLWLDPAYRDQVESDGALAPLLELAEAFATPRQRST